MCFASSFAFRFLLEVFATYVITSLPSNFPSSSFYYYIYIHLFNYLKNITSIFLLSCLKAFFALVPLIIRSLNPVKWQNKQLSNKFDASYSRWKFSWYGEAVKHCFWGIWGETEIYRALEEITQKKNWLGGRGFP